MRLRLMRMRKPSAEGRPYIYLSKSDGPIQMFTGKTVEVPDKAAHEILERDGDIVEKVRNAPQKAKKQTPPENKMMGTERGESYEVKSDGAE